MKDKIKNQSGYIALTTVLIILAVVVITAVSVTYSSIGEAQSGLALYKGEENLHFVEGCVEDMLLEVRSNSSFTSGTISRPEGTCVITVVSKVGSGTVTWTVDTTSQSTAYQRTIRTIFTRSPTVITLTSWNEI
jgi:hypothetical protein